MASVNYSIQLQSALGRFFMEKTYGTPTYVGDTNADIRFNNHNFNPVFLRISNCQNEGILRVPSLIRTNNVEDSILRREGYEYVAPLSILGSNARRTADSIFGYFFNTNNRYNYSNRIGLKKVETNKGETYYGAPGLILDRDFKPLAIGISEYTQEGFRLELERHVLKVSPSVFASDGLLEKAIIKKLIPYYTSRNFEGRTVRVEVDNIDQYIVKPVPPRAKVQESLKDILHTYKDEILFCIL